MFIRITLDSIYAYIYTEIGIFLWSISMCICNLYVSRNQLASLAITTVRAQFTGGDFSHTIYALEFRIFIDKVLTWLPVQLTLINL